MSVSQCGYNTALEVVRSGVPALFVPFAAPGEDEQTRRAMRLAALGLARVLDPAALDPPALAEALRATRTFRPTAPRLDLSGAEASTELLERALHGRIAA